MGGDAYAEAFGGQALVGQLRPYQPRQPVARPRVDSDHVGLPGNLAGPFWLYGAGAMNIGDKHPIRGYHRRGGRPVLEVDFMAVYDAVREAGQEMETPSPALLLASSRSAPTLLAQQTPLNAAKRPWWKLW